MKRKSVKVCGKCKIEKPVEEFHKASNTQDGFQSRCKECNSNGVMLKYRTDPEYSVAIKRRERLYVKEFKDRVNKIKSDNGCCICGEDEYSCLDFHHKEDEEKEACISGLIRRKNWSKVELEIQKCIILCANCHRKLHAGRITL